MASNICSSPASMDFHCGFPSATLRVTCDMRPRKTRTMPSSKEAGPICEITIPAFASSQFWHLKRSTTNSYAKCRWPHLLLALLYSRVDGLHHPRGHRQPCPSKPYGSRGSSGPRSDVAIKCPHQERNQVQGAGEQHADRIQDARRAHDLSLAPGSDCHSGA